MVGTIGGMRGRPELIDSARRAVFALFGVISVAALSLLVALLTRDFNVEYVWSYTSRQLPTVYTLSAFWAGQAGSLLFWALILTGFAAAAMWITPSRYRQLMPYVGAVTCTVALFFIATMLFSANPFDRLPFTPADGNGLNPQLQNPGMAIHPPMLYLGYVSITIPFAFTVAALMSRQMDAGWVHAIRKWTLLSWVFLSVGITLGMWWAYVELGWGGYWAWDPVENASFLPWLTMTAFLHSVMIQEKRSMLKKWNIVLIMLSFLLSIFGTFITRSGIISSVHSFTQSNLGYFFLVFLVVACVFLAWLLWSRLPGLKSEGHLEMMTAFLHSVMIQEKRSMLKKWNIVLIMLSFLLSIFGTFITRSGIISSVHSFTQSNIGYFFLNHHRV